MNSNDSSDMKLSQARAQSLSRLHARHSFDKFNAVVGFANALAMCVALLPISPDSDPSSKRPAHLKALLVGRCLPHVLP